MTFSTGSITSATPAQALLTALDTALLAVTGWSKPTSLLVVGTNTWSVYKSAAANNSFGSDFYVAFGYVTATGTILHMTVFEQWNSGSNLATNFAPNSSQTPTATTWANPNAAAALPTTGTTIAFIDTPVLGASLFNYTVDVTADRIGFGMFANALECGYYLGLYDTFLPLASDPFPLCCIQLGPNFGASANAMTTAPLTLQGFTTREPLQVTLSGNNFGAGCSGATGNTWTLTNAGGVELYTGKIMLARVLIQGRAAGGYRGLLKDCYQGPGQTHAGDQMTWTINSVAHTATRLGGVSSTGIYMDNV